MHLADHILRHFPPPAYLDAPTVGVDLSDRSVKWLKFERGKHGLEIGSWGEQDIPEGFIEDGIVKRPNELQKQLVSLRAMIGEPEVSVALPEEQAYIVSMELPSMRRRDLREGILLSLEQYVPLSPQEVIFDYEIIRSPSRDFDGYQISVAAFPDVVARSYFNIFTAAGFIPQSFETESQALARALMPAQDIDATMILDIGRIRTGIAITCGQTVWFSSSVSIGGAAVTSHLAEALSISREVAESRKRERGFERAVSTQDVDLPSVQPATLSDIFSPLRDEVLKHMEYWNEHGRSRVRLTREHEGEITAIVLVGGEANLPGLTDYMAYSTGLPVRLGEPWVNALSFDDVIPEIVRGEDLRFVSAIGLALRPSRDRGTYK